MCTCGCCNLTAALTAFFGVFIIILGGVLTCCQHCGFLLLFSICITAIKVICLAASRHLHNLYIHSHRPRSFRLKPLTADISVTLALHAHAASDSLQFNFIGSSFQKWSSLFLNIFVDEADTTFPSREFHNTTIRWLCSIAWSVPDWHGVA